MNYLNDLKIGKRLALGFGVLLVFSMIITALGVVKLNEIASTSQEMMEVPVTKERLINDWSQYINVAVIRTLAIAKSSDTALVPFFAANAKETSSKSTELLKQIEPLISSPEEKALFDKLIKQRKI